ncbi:hypothetical protein CDV31_002860 [Fusarium ambrosium]|uniref:Uncharacterized protein n=1 Tax=Fusarium ambrosium TaxID=131363 RepID=A0A428UVL4_9HYPO|nr:hypothetical protein CDV31_002860 [Fusarium ambrosium]
MADIYTPPKDSAYLLSTAFRMPHKNGDKWAMAFDNHTGPILTAGLSVVITIIGLCLWNLICFFGMFFDGKKTRRRYVGLVVLWNSNDPWFACKELLYYAFQCVKGPKDWSNFRYGFGLGLTAFIVFAGGIAASISVPGALLIGSVAPVRPSSVFWPDDPDDTVKSLQVFGLQAPAAMRSLGSVEAAEVTLRDRVYIKRHPKSSGPNDDEPVSGIEYNYALSGVDMGLRWGSQLFLNVTGSCTTEYGWADKRANNSDQGDFYNLWNNDSLSIFVPISKDVIINAPSASFMPHPHGYTQLLKDSNVSYAVMIYAAHRSSISKSTDPWYATEKRNESDNRFQSQADYWMKRYRPFLSCWQQDKWSYGSHSVKSVDELKNVPGIKIKQVLLEILESAFGMSPMIVKLGTASGVSALRSQTTSPNGVIDAEKCLMVDDMERLILASFVASRSIFTDATMFPKVQYTNIVTGPDKKPRSGAGDFVLSSPEIQTFSLGGITALLVVWGVLVLANFATSQLLSFFYRNQHMDEKDNKLVDVDRWTRFRVLTAVQLFRRLYESSENKVEQCEWSCEKTVPDVKNGDYEVKLVGGCGEDRCMGHLSKTLIEGEATTPSDGGKSDRDPKDNAVVVNRAASDDEVVEGNQEKDAMLPKQVNP